MIIILMILVMVVGVMKMMKKKRPTAMADSESSLLLHCSVCLFGQVSVELTVRHRCVRSAVGGAPCDSDYRIIILHLPQNNTICQRIAVICLHAQTGLRVNNRTVCYSQKLSYELQLCIRFLPCFVLSSGPWSKPLFPPPQFMGRAAVNTYTQFIALSGGIRPYRSAICVRPNY
jgi:hypothetical protein